MKSRRIVLLVFGSLVVGAICAVGVVLYQRFYDNWLNKFPQKYCYDTARHVVNPAFIIHSLALKDDLVSYYNSVYKDPAATPTIGFGIQTIPRAKKVYVTGYTSDSLLAKIVVYYNRGPLYSTNKVTGWVYFKTIQDNPPDPSRMRKRSMDLLEMIELSKKNDSIKSSQ